MKNYDVIIIGGGPAGLNAALYAARKEIRAVVITTDFGGQILLTSEIENYLGFPSITGFELAEKMESHARQYPVDFEIAQVETLTREADGSFHVHLDDGQDMSGRACIVTAGKRSRTLDIPGEAAFTGRGVSYCATCDGPFYKNKIVAVVGGGDSAVQAAIELAGICPKVYLLVRSRIRAQEILVKRMQEHDNIEVLTGCVPERIEGEKRVQTLAVRYTATGETGSLAVDGCFVEAGGIPNNGFLPAEVEQNPRGEIVTDKAGRTNVPGLFAAGDVTDGPYKQVIIAAGEGAAAALSAHEYLLMNE